VTKLAGLPVVRATLLAKRVKAREKSIVGLPVLIPGQFSGCAAGWHCASPNLNLQCNTYPGHIYDIQEVKMRGPHDVGGLDFGPIDTSTHDLTLWEKQIDAIRAVIGSKGIVSTHENRRTIEQLGHDAYDTLNYYERWTASLARQMIDKGVLTQDEIDARVAEVRKRLADTGELELNESGSK
jgi:hypothetical protein